MPFLCAKASASVAEIIETRRSVETTQIRHFIFPVLLSSMEGGGAIIRHLMLFAHSTPDAVRSFEGRGFYLMRIVSCRQ